MLLLCNVVIYERKWCARVAAVELEQMLSIIGNYELGPIAIREREGLGRVVEEIAKG